jgi:hypothetical protein
MAVSLKEYNWFFVRAQTPCPYPTRSLPAQLKKNAFEKGDGTGVCKL